MIVWRVVNNQSTSSMRRVKFYGMSLSCNLLSFYKLLHTDKPFAELSFSKLSLDQKSAGAPKCEAALKSPESSNQFLMRCYYTLHTRTLTHPYTLTKNNFLWLKQDGLLKRQKETFHSTFPHLFPPRSPPTDFSRNWQVVLFAKFETFCCTYFFILKLQSLVKIKIFTENDRGKNEENERFLEIVKSVRKFVR